MCGRAPRPVQGKQAWCWWRARHPSHRRTRAPAAPSAAGAAGGAAAAAGWQRAWWTGCLGLLATRRSSAYGACPRRRGARCAAGGGAAGWRQGSAAARLLANPLGAAALRLQSGGRRQACTLGLDQGLHRSTAPAQQPAQTKRTPPLALDIQTTAAPQILAKAEFLNPGGSVKDRVALRIVQEALASGALAAPGGLITEGTAGSTGIALAMVTGPPPWGAGTRGRAPAALRRPSWQGFFWSQCPERIAWHWVSQTGPKAAMCVAQRLARLTWRPVPPFAHTPGRPGPGVPLLHSHAG